MEHVSVDLSPDGGERVIACADEQSAKAEAARQQRTETDGAEWIYLRVKGQWMAKRYVGSAAATKPKTVRSWIGGVLLDPMSWLPH